MDEARRAAAARIERDEALCPNCAEVHAKATENGYAYCPSCEAKCSLCGGDSVSYGKAPHCGLLTEPCPHGVEPPGHCGGLLPREQWPDTFTEDLEMPGFGTWVCAACRNGATDDDDDTSGSDVRGTTC